MTQTSEKTRVVNLKRKFYDTYIGRAGKGQSGYFGNPFVLQPGEHRGVTLERYEAYFLNRLSTDLEFAHKVRALKGKVLGCFCKPAPCHGDIMANWIDNDQNHGN